MTPENIITDLSNRRREGPMNKCSVISLIIGLVLGLVIGGLGAGMLGARYEAVDLGYALVVIGDMDKRLSQSEQREKDLQNKIKELEQREKARP